MARRDYAHTPADQPVSRTLLFICARTDKLAARCHWAAFRFSSGGETATSFLDSESSLSISVAWYDLFLDFNHSA